MGFQEVWEVARLIPGWYLEEEAHLLYSMALTADTGLGILEVGCYAGRSTRILAEVSNQSRTCLFIIDSFNHNHPIEGVEPLKSVTRMLAEEECVYRLITSETKDVDIFTLPRFDFVHIDDSHLKADLEIDRERILPLLRVGGYAAFHDYHPNWPDVVSFVDSLRPSWKEVARESSLIVLEKP